MSSGLCVWMETDMSEVVGGGSSAPPLPRLDPLHKPVEAFEETGSATKTRMKSELYLRESAGTCIC